MYLMEQKNRIISIEFDYGLFADDVHQMDARTYNECERQLINALDIIKKYTGNFQVDVVAKKEGSVIGTFLVSLGVDAAKDGTISLLGALCKRIFRRRDPLEDAQKRVEILEKLKTGNFTAEEAQILVDGDAKLTECVSKFYKPLAQCPEIRDVSGSITERTQIDLLIERKDNIVNMCEMKFYSEEFTVSKVYHKTLVHRSNLLLEHLSPKMAIHPILITTYGLTHNEYSREFINCVTFNELFES